MTTNELGPQFHGTRESCTQGLHRFYDSRRASASGARACAICGAVPVDWNRLHRLVAADIPYVVSALQLEAAREWWWTAPLDERAQRSLLLVRRGGIRQRIAKRLEQSLNKLYVQPNGRLAPFRDGRQTPYTGGVIYYAQHATATCCRRCVACWFGIEEGRLIRREESEFLVEIVLAYLHARFGLSA